MEWQTYAIVWLWAWGTCISLGAIGVITPSTPAKNPLGTLLFAMAWPILFPAVSVRRILRGLT